MLNKKDLHRDLSKSSAAAFLSKAAKESSSAGDEKKAENVIMSQLGQLLDLLAAGSDSNQAQSMTVSESSNGSDLSNLMAQDPSKVADMIKAIVEKKVPESELATIIDGLQEYFKEQGNAGVPKAIELLTALFDGSEGQKKAQDQLAESYVHMARLNAATERGETSPSKVINHPYTKEFFTNLTRVDIPRAYNAVKESLAKVLEGKPGDEEFISSVMKIVRSTVHYKQATPEVLDTLKDSNQLKALYNKRPAAQKAGLGALKDKAEQNKPSQMSYKDAIMALAVDLQALLSNIYKSQTSQSDMMTKISKTTTDDLKTSTKTSVDNMNDEIAKQQEAQKNSWVGTFLGILGMIICAVITAFTAGAAAPFMIAAEVIIGSIMMSPAGSDITNALATALDGGPKKDDDGDDESPSTGATIGAQAIIAVATALLTFGAGGFTTVATDAAVDVAVDVGSAVAEDVGSAGAKVATKAAQDAEEAAADTAADAADGADSAGDVSGEGSGSVSDIEDESEVENLGSKTLKKLASNTEKASEDAIDEAGDAADEVNDAEDPEDNDTKVKGKKKWSVRFNKEALFGGGPGNTIKRFLSTYIQNFLGSGVIFEGIEAGLEKWDPAALQDSNAMTWIAIGSAIATAGISAGVGLSFQRTGMAEREQFLEDNNMGGGGLTASKSVKTIMYAIQGLAQLATAGVAIDTFILTKGISDAQKALGLARAQTTAADSVQKQLKSMQKNQSDEAQTLIKAAQGTLAQVVDCFAVEGQNAASALVG